MSSHEPLLSPSTTLGPQRVCRLVKDKGVACTTRRSEVAEKQPLGLTAEGAFGNPCNGGGLCAARCHLEE